MIGGAQLSVTDLRQAARHPVDYPVLAEHRRIGDIHMLVTNVSSNGFMVDGELPIGRGERVMLRLPEIGRIEAHVIWVAEGRAGFQFERIIRPDAFVAMVDQMQPRAKPRPRLRK
ncbi:pilus assembly protein PilZ [Croceicoccus bisphenolivorans]|uniref:pilus assembly protein PilZ n=1 Tax=Croceicoccus bisphenolivorans TaxID=1783232 RepID=UPI00082CBFBA|nr:pilus assembly protein PilZ [Croceicoccus bisphenolivorans]